MQRARWSLWWLPVVALACFGACKEDQAVSSPMVGIDRLAAQFDDSARARLGRLRVFFAHQSVGNNVVDGLASWQRRLPDLRLTVVRSSAPDSIVGPVFAHDDVGENGNPGSKTAGFVRIMGDAALTAPWIGVSKYCYADFGLETDPRQVFDDYVRILDTLRREHPEVQVVHVTAPLMTLENRLKDLARRVLGRTRVVDRIRRVNAYNEMMRNRFGGSEPVFDLAAIESRGPDGVPATIRDGERRLPSLSPAFTDDGGHLNAVGREIVAGELLLFLARLPFKPQ